MPPKKHSKSNTKSKSKTPQPKIARSGKKKSGASSKISPQKTSSNRKKVSMSGMGLRRWNDVRTSVKAFMSERGMPYGRDELTAYTKAVYKSIKGDYAMRFENIEEVLSEYFLEGDVEGGLYYFPWWDLSDEITKHKKPSGLIVVDNEAATGVVSFEGVAADFTTRVFSSIVNQINTTYERKKYFSYLMYDKDVKGVNVRYFLLVDDDDGFMADMSPEEFESWMQEQGISLASIIGRNMHRVVVDMDAMDRASETIAFEPKKGRSSGSLSSKSGKRGKKGAKWSKRVSGTQKSKTERKGKVVEPLMRKSRITKEDIRREKEQKALAVKNELRRKKYKAQKNKLAKAGKEKTLKAKDLMALIDKLKSIGMSDAEIKEQVKRFK